MHSLLVGAFGSVTMRLAVHGITRRPKWDFRCTECQKGQTDGPVYELSSSVELATTVDCRSCYKPTCTDSMWQIESGSSSPSQSTGVCTTRRQSTWQTAVWDIAGRLRLRTAHRRQLDVPRYQRTTLGRRAFSVAGTTVWNSLPDELRDETENTFRQSLKTLLFRQGRISHSGAPCQRKAGVFFPYT